MGEGVEEMEGLLDMMAVSFDQPFFALLKQGIRTAKPMVFSVVQGHHYCIGIDPGV